MSYEQIIILPHFQKTLMTVLVNYAMFSIDPEMLVNISSVKYFNLTGYQSISNYQEYRANAVKLVMDNKQHLGKLMLASLPSCGRMGLVCRWQKLVHRSFQTKCKVVFCAITSEIFLRWIHNSL